MQGLDKSRISFLEDSLHVAYVAGTDTRKASNLLSHLNMRTFGQICRTLVSAPTTLIVKRLLLEVRLQFHCQPNAVEIVPIASRLMAYENELKGFFVAQGILKAFDSRLGTTYRGMPCSEAGDDCAICCDLDGLTQKPAFQLGGLAELNHRID